MMVCKAFSNSSIGCSLYKFPVSKSIVFDDMPKVETTKFRGFGKPHSIIKHKKEEDDKMSTHGVGIK
jgi:hypothetical protein